MIISLAGYNRPGFPTPGWNLSGYCLGITMKFGGLLPKEATFPASFPYTLQKKRQLALGANLAPGLRRALAPKLYTPLSDSNEGL